MSAVNSECRYLKSHEWARQESDGTIAIGISDHAQEALGELVFVELPEVGKVLDKGATAAVVESVKAASDVYAPVAGKVVAINETLGDKPETINGDCYGAGWLFKVQPSNADDFASLLDAATYQAGLED